MKKSNLTTLAVASLALGAATLRCAPTDRPDPEIGKVTRAIVPKIDWRQFGGDPSHTGWNQTTNGFTANAMTQLRKKRSPPAALQNEVYSTPVFVSSLHFPGVGDRDVAYVTARTGVLYCVDVTFVLAPSIIWRSDSDHPPAAFPAATAGFVPSPAVDVNREYIYSAEGDGKIHKYGLTSATEIHTSPWPVAFTTKMTSEPHLTSLTIANGVTDPEYLYVGVGGCEEAGGGTGGCQGHVTTINLVNGVRTVFNAMCSGTFSLIQPNGCPQTMSGIWARAGVTFDPVTQHLFASTGNGNWTPAGHQWGDTVLELSVDGKGTPGGFGNPLDSFTPVQGSDLANMDLGSANVLVVPGNIGITGVPHVGFVTGKRPTAFLVNLDNLSGQGGPGFLGQSPSMPQIARPFGQPVFRPIATWINPADGKAWFYVNSQGGMEAFRADVSGGAATLANPWNAAAGGNGSGVFISDGMVFYSDTTNLVARDAVTGAIVWATPVLSGQWTPVAINSLLWYGLTAYGYGNTTIWPTTFVAESTQWDVAIPQRGVDGFTDGNFWNGHVFHTLNDAASAPGTSGGPYWYQDFGMVKSVSNVVLYNRTDCCAERLSAFRINVWNEGTASWMQAFDGSNITASPANPVITLSINTSTRKVMVQKINSGGDHFLHLAEVRSVSP